MLAALLLATTAAAQDAPETAFDFRSRLAIGGEAVDTGGEPGPYNFSFRAFDHPDPGQGRQLGLTLERPRAVLADGLFVTRLDFGAATPRGARIWVETTVVEPTDGENGERLIARSRQEVVVGAGAPRPDEPAVPPATSDAEILARLDAVRVILSDRQSPGAPHFVIDQESFRRAFGVGQPVTTTDVAAVSLVSASELRREAVRAQERMLALEAELSSLRFRGNMTLLLLAAVVVSLLVQRGLDARRTDTDAVANAAVTDTADTDPADPELANTELADTDLADTDLADTDLADTEPAAQETSPTSPTI
ncbi:MAG: hypothetical protein AAGC60_22870 [Acidobacteriota bacterium]